MSATSLAVHFIPDPAVVFTRATAYVRQAGSSAEPMAVPCPAEDIPGHWTDFHVPAGLARDLPLEVQLELASGEEAVRSEWSQPVQARAFNRFLEHAESVACLEFERAWSNKDCWSLGHAPTWDEVAEIGPGEVVINGAEDVAVGGITFRGNTTLSVNLAGKASLVVGSIGDERVISRSASDATPDSWLAVDMQSALGTIRLGRPTGARATDVASFPMMGRVTSVARRALAEAGHGWNLTVALDAELMGPFALNGTVLGEGTLRVSCLQARDLRFAGTLLVREPSIAEGGVCSTGTTSRASASVVGDVDLGFLHIVGTLSSLAVVTVTPDAGPARLGGLRVSDTVIILGGHGGQGELELDLKELTVLSSQVGVQSVYRAINVRGPSKLVNAEVQGLCSFDGCELALNILNFDLEIGGACALTGRGTLNFLADPEETRAGTSAQRNSIARKSAVRRGATGLGAGAGAEVDASTRNILVLNETTQLRMPTWRMAISVLTSVDWGMGPPEAQPLLFVEALEVFVSGKLDLYMPVTIDVGRDLYVQQEAAISLESSDADLTLTSSALYTEVYFGVVGDLSVSAMLPGPEFPLFRFAARAPLAVAGTMSLPRAQFHRDAIVYLTGSLTVGVEFVEWSVLSVQVDEPNTHLEFTSVKSVPEGKIKPGQIFLSSPLGLFTPHVRGFVLRSPLMIVLSGNGVLLLASDTAPVGEKPLVLEQRLQIMARDGWIVQVVGEVRVDAAAVTLGNSTGEATSQAVMAAAAERQLKGIWPAVPFSSGEGIAAAAERFAALHWSEPLIGFAVTGQEFFIAKDLTVLRGQVMVSTNRFRTGAASRLTILAAGHFSYDTVLPDSGGSDGDVSTFCNFEGAGLVSGVLHLDTSVCGMSGHGVIGSGTIMCRTLLSHP